ncbi:MAG: hypothetical protein IT181_24440 [Acidobacteria bacterium]|nr:hypothetical protein [Acidobacteriota bacterium]
MAPGSARARSTGHRRQLTALLVGAVLLYGVGAAHAQPVATTVASGTTVGGSLALASVWDDETRLGEGVGLAAEASTPLGPHVRVGVESGWFRHTRDSGYLAANGHVLHLMGRADVFLAPRTWRARPFIGAAVGVARSTGTLSFPTFGAGGASATTTRLPWAHTQPAWNLRLGARLGAGERVAVRPEVSVGAIGTSDNAGALELPLLRLQGGVAVEWGLRR